MNKDEILKMSRMENKNKDFVEEQKYKSSAFVGTVVGWCSIALVLILSGIIAHKANYAAYFIFFAIQSGIFVTKYVKLRKRHELFVSVIYVLAAISMAVLFILELLGVIR